MLDSVLNSFLRQEAWPINSFAIIVRPPRRTINIDVVAVEAERGRLHQICHFSVEHSNTTDVRIVGNTNAANVIVRNGCYFTCAPSSVSFVMSLYINVFRVFIFLNIT